jgi:hypothetical protein
MGRDSRHAHNDLISTSLAIAEERSNMLDQIRSLLEAGKNEEAIPLMKQYCGLSDDKKGNRVN